MNKRQKSKLRDMKKALGLIEIIECDSSDKDNEKIEKFTDEFGTQYKIIDTLTEEEKAEYLQIQNANNILQIKKGVKFFVALAAIGIAIGIILAIIVLVS